MAVTYFYRIILGRSELFSEHSIYMQDLTEPIKPKLWKEKREYTDDIRRSEAEIAKALSLTPVLSRILALRGYDTPKAASSFLRMETELLCDPFLLADIEPAVSRIRAAIEANERITVYGDYDVDGVTAVCTLYLYLKEKGADVDYYIPNRTGEGYGVSTSAVEKLAAAGTRLIVTVDTGITANAEVAFAKTLGVDFVVTDHHECRSDLPEASAVVNPHRPDCLYPFKELAGVGVVFKLISALEERMTGDSRHAVATRLCRTYSDLVAIGTIADVMPVRGENRLIIAYGLRLVCATERIGLRALMNASAAKGDQKKSKSPQKITSGYIGFTIAPRINAAGRLRSAERAVELFLSENEEKAALLAEELCEINRLRQQEENSIMQEAYAKLEEDPSLLTKPVIILDADHWHHGVIGIVSSRITEKYGLPSILISFEGCDTGEHSDDDIGKGSGRSVKGMNLVDALVHASEHLVKFGGHELAAGLSVTRGELPAFREAMWAYAEDALHGDDFVPTMEYDCVLNSDDVSMNLVEELQLLEPYGVANAQPIFVMKELQILEASPVSGGKHTRFLLSKGDMHFQGIFFGKPTAALNLFAGDIADVMFQLDINEWNGKRSVQLIVRDIRLSESVTTPENADRESFERIWAGAEFTAEENIIPTREDFAAVYQLVRRSVRSGCDTLSHRAILSHLSTEGFSGIGYIKLKIIIRVLQEMNLLGITENAQEQYAFKIRYSDKKVDLEKSTILRKLRARQKA